MSTSPEGPQGCGGWVCLGSGTSETQTSPKDSPGDDQHLIVRAASMISSQASSSTRPAQGGGCDPRLQRPGAWSSSGKALQRCGGHLGPHPS